MPALLAAIACKNSSARRKPSEQASIDEEVTMGNPDRVLSFWISGVGENFYACFALLCLLTRTSMLVLLACFAY